MHFVLSFYLFSCPAVLALLLSKIFNLQHFLSYKTVDNNSGLFNKQNASRCLQFSFAHETYLYRMHNIFQPNFLEFIPSIIKLASGFCSFCANRCRLSIAPLKQSFFLSGCFQIIFAHLGTFSYFITVTSLVVFFFPYHSFIRFLILCLLFTKFFFINSSASVCGSSFPFLSYLDSG